MFHDFSNSLPDSAPWTSTQILARKNFYTDNYGKKDLQQDGPVTGALQQFLYLALRSPHLRDLLELPEDVLSEWLQCIEAQNSLGDPFADAWKCAQKQHLLEAAKLQHKGQEKQGSVSFWQRLRGVTWILGEIAHCLNRKGVNEISDLLDSGYRSDDTRGFGLPD